MSGCSRGIYLVYVPGNYLRDYFTTLGGNFQGELKFTSIIRGKEMCLFLTLRCQGTSLKSPGEFVLWEFRSLAQRYRDTYTNMKTDRSGSCKLMP